MKSTAILASVAACTIFGLAGCGGGGDRQPQIFSTQILSNSALDGDIEQVGTNSFTITQGMTPQVQNVLAGIDPAGGTEFRAFLDFPLTGSGGVPADARIDTATLEIFIDDVQPVNGSLPVRIDLVSFPQPMAGTDFDVVAQPPLATVKLSAPVTHSSAGNSIMVDVTGLMVEAQRQQLNDFQIRIMEDLGPAVETLMAIDDTTGADRPKFAPLLTVDYF